MPWPVGVWDGIVEAPDAEELSEPAGANVRVVVNPENDFVTAGKGNVKGLNEIAVKARKGVRGLGAGVAER